MGLPIRHHRYTYPEYLALEQLSPIRHEFVDGEIYAMAGGTPAHAALAAQVLRLVGNRLPAGCRAYTSDLRVRITAAALSTYPDGAVICGKVIPALDDSHAATNPCLLIEVTSPSTEEYDRGDKLEQYRSLPSVREVLVVSHRAPSLALHRRLADGTWRLVEAHPGQGVELACTGARLETDEVYRDWSEG